MTEFETIKVEALLSDDRGISVGVMYPGEDTPGGTPLIRVADIIDARISDRVSYRISSEVHEQYRRTKLVGGECLITLVGRPGIAVKVSEEFRGWNVARALAVLRLKDPTEADYLVYALASPQVQHTIRNWCNTTVQATLNLKEIRALPLPWPKKSDRQAIANILTSLDDKIELNRRMNETLEAMARAIFKDWFVDFGPTRAKMEGRAAYLAADVWSLFPDRLDDEGNPEGWILGTLGDVAHQTGESVKPDSLDPTTPYVGLEHMPRKSIALSEWAGAGKVTSGKLAFRRGDFLFGKLRPYFHKVGIAPVDGICSTDIVVLNARERKAAAFVLACISQDEFVAFTDRTSDGTKMPRTSWSRMEQYNLCLPGEAAIAAYNACVEPMLNRIVSNIHESRTLAATRDLLLPKLMSGEIRIKDAEKIAGEAA